jgi:hypothetical protein
MMFQDSDCEKLSPLLHCYVHWVCWPSRKKKKKKKYADLKVSNAGNNSWVLLLCLVGQMTLQSWCRRWALNLSQLCTNRPFVQVYSWGAPLGDQRRSRCYKVPLTICSFAIECLRSFLVPVADLESIICFHCFMKLKNKRLCPLH